MEQARNQANCYDTVGTERWPQHSEPSGTKPGTKPIAMARWDRSAVHSTRNQVEPNLEPNPIAMARWDPSAFHSIRNQAEPSPEPSQWLWYGVIS